MMNDAEADRNMKEAGTVEQLRKGTEDRVWLPLTRCELSLLGLAAWRLMNDAYAKHNAESVRRSNAVDAAEESKRASAFWQDALDAEELVGKLRALSQRNKD